MIKRASGPRVAVLTTLLCLLLGLLAGCSNDAESPRAKAAAPKPTSPKTTAEAPPKALTKGTCWDDTQLPEALGAEAFEAWVDEHARGEDTLARSMRNDAAFTEQIDCAEAHSLELYNVVTLQPALTAQIRQYADLLDQRSALYRRIRDQVNDRCVAGSAYDVGPRRASGISVQLGPTLNANGGLHVAWDPFPADRWSKGERKFVCTFEQDVPGTLRFADLTTGKVPVTARVCVNTPGKVVPCRGKHHAEDIADVLLSTAVARREVDVRKAVRKGPDGPYVALSDVEYAKLDRVCQSFLSSVSTVKGGVVAKLYPGAVDQWPSAAGLYIARCMALKDVSEPPPKIAGSVFNKAGP
jgi:hypothetical protein